MNEEKRKTGVHNLILEERKSLTVTGVSDVDSFDEQTVVAYTDLGELTVKGSSLHIEKIDLDAGELAIDGEIDSLSYSDRPSGKGSLLARIFR